MRHLIVAALAVAIAVPAVAAAATWKPGTPFYIAEEDANRLLERTYDSAFCDGIARFGKRGEFPYEEYLRFDCSTERNGQYCTDARYKSVKAARRNYFRLVLVVKPDCF